MPPSVQVQSLAQRLFDELDYETLGAVYCDEGGREFWDAHREPALNLGMRWAAACVERVSPGGRSLYVGSGVAELPVLLTEACDLNREVHVFNLDGSECESLNASLEAVGLSDLVRFQNVDAAVAVSSDPGMSYDHLSVVSVFNDPVRYPSVSGVAYGRTPPPLLDIPAFVAERDQLRGLATAILGGLSIPGVITTTVEEVAWFLSAAADRGLTIEADEEMVPTAIVGDPLGFLRVR